MKLFWKRFLRCGAAGWLWECTWSGIWSFFQKDYLLTCRTSLWMFPIYGLACLVCPIYSCIKKRCVLFRGFVYAIVIFIGEYLTGSILKRHSVCPWSYDHAKLNINGIIRLDYLPAWMVAGLMFERIVLKTGCESPSCPQEDGKEK